MTFLLDNIIAVVVGTVLIGALFIVQQRGQQSAVDATQRYQAQKHASELVTVVQREVENLRSRTATRRAFALRQDDAGRPADTYRMRLLQKTGADGEPYTAQFSFPTLDFEILDPDDPTGSRVITGVVLVTYRVEPTADVAVIDGRQRPLYTITGSVYRRGDAAPEDGSVYEGVVDFDVTAFLPDGTQVTDQSLIDPAPTRVHVTLVTAPVRAAARTVDQASTPLTSTRYARTVRAIGATAAGGTAPVNVSKSGGIPALTSDDPPPPRYSGTPPTSGTEPELTDIDCDIVICS